MIQGRRNCFVKSRAVAFVLLMCVALNNVYATEYLIKSRVNTAAIYNDNIFLEAFPPESVSSLAITPGVSVLAREASWESTLNAKISNYTSNNESIERNDKFIDVSGKYFTARDTFTLNAAYDLDSTLNSNSSDFGIADERVDRETTSIGPEYIRRLTERLSVLVSYNHTDVDYLNATTTSFVSYITDMESGSFIYGLSELDQLNFTLQNIDYESKDKNSEYNMIIARVGMNHKLSETLSVDYKVGVSRREITRRGQASTIFFGIPVTLFQETDYTDTGAVLEAGMNYELEESSYGLRISRDNVTNSFGGLNESDKIRLEYNRDVTSLLSYSIDTWYEDVEAISGNVSFSTRSTIYFEPGIKYSLDKDLDLNVSYRYIRRDYDFINVGRAPESNQLYIGILYRFPVISTF